MSEENIGISGGPSETPRRRPSPKKAIASALVAQDKKKSRKIRLYRDYPKAYVTRTCLGRYKARHNAKEHGYIISLLQIDDVWYIQLTTSLARLLGYKNALEFCKANRGDIHVFLTVAYPKHSYLKSPPEDCHVHNTSFVKYDQYLGWLQKKRQHFLKFLMGTFDILQMNRNFAPPRYTDNTFHNIAGSTKSLPFGPEIEETSDKDILPDHSEVSAPVVVSGASQELILFGVSYDEEFSKIQKQEQHTSTDVGTHSQEELNDLRDQNFELIKLRNRLADVFSMSEASEKDRKVKNQHFKTLGSLAAKDRAKSEG